MTLSSCWAWLPNSPMALRRAARSASLVAVCIRVSVDGLTTSAGAAAVGGGGTRGTGCQWCPGDPPPFSREAIQIWVSRVPSSPGAYQSRKFRALRIRLTTSDRGKNGEFGRYRLLPDLGVYPPHPRPAQPAGLLHHLSQWHCGDPGRQPPALDRDLPRDIRADRARRTRLGYIPLQSTHQTRMPRSQRSRVDGRLKVGFERFTDTPPMRHDPEPGALRPLRR